MKELGGKPACVAEADAANEQAQPGQTPAQWPMQHTTARRRPEITRFKRLGEISPKEFAQFIGKGIRLSKVEHAPKPNAAPILNSYMGKNTPERKDYSMELQSYRLLMPKFAIAIVARLV